MLALDYATRVICAMLSKWDESPRVDCFQNGMGSPADVWAQVQWGHTLVRESPSGVRSPAVVLARVQWGPYVSEKERVPLEYCIDSLVLPEWFSQ